MSALSSFVRKAAKRTGRSVDDILDEIGRSPRNLRKFLRLADPTSLWRGPHRVPPGQKLPIVPPEYAASVKPGWHDMLDAYEEGDVSACQRAGAKSWTITTTVLLAAGAVAADTDFGATTNPFANANSAFFTTAGVFPQPFLCYGIGGMLHATQPAAATETAAALDSIYMSMRATTELSRQSLTRDLGFAMNLSGNTAAAAATGGTSIAPTAYRPWRQFFDPRTTYVWGGRFPRAITTVGAMSYTLILHGLLLEGGAMKVGRR